jgi:hypothetical protein
MADPYCFDTVEKRIIFAALNINGNMQDLWAHAYIK